MLPMKLWLWAPILLSSVVVTMYSSKALEGYSAGFLGDCPGSLKPAIITKKSLKYLTITVIGAKATPLSKRQQYTYFQMKELAKDPTMDFNKKIVMYLGGYMDSAHFADPIIMEIFYRSLGYNVWLLDVNRFVTVEYPAAVRFIRAAGRHTGEMLANLTEENTGFDPKKFELLSISLGGQIISFIAKSYKSLTGLKISRVTALDPSGVCFRNLGPDDRLDQTDADKVDIIYTNIVGYAMAAPVGHVNFYVNGGEYQPGDIYWLPCTVICSHVRAYLLWLSALVNPDSFIAMRCNSVQQARDNKCFDNKPMVTNVMGLKTDWSKPGIYYLATEHYFPYHMRERGLTKGQQFFIAKLKSINSIDLLKL